MLLAGAASHAWAQAPVPEGPVIGPTGRRPGVSEPPPPDAPPSAATEEGIEPPPPPPPSPPAAALEGGEERHGPVVEAAVGQGFRLIRADGRQSLRIGGLFSGRAAMFANDDQDVRWDAFMRIGRIILSGHLAGEKLTYLFQGEFAGTPSLLDMELTWSPIEQLRFRFGRVRVPTGRQWITGLGAIMLPDRSVVSDIFHPGRDTGVTVESYLLDDKIELRAGAYAESADRWPRFAARAAFSPLGAVPYSEDLNASPGPTLFQIAANVSYDKHDVPPNPIAPPPSPIADRTTGGFELAFRSGPFAAFAEAYVARRHFFAVPAAGTPGLTFLAAGTFVQAGVFVVPSHMEVYGRFDLYAQDIRNTGSDGLQRYEAGLGGYFFGTALKVQARYAYNDLVGSPVASLPPGGAALPAQGHTADVQFVLSL